MQIPGRRFFDNDDVLTDWIPRGGDNVILRADRVASNPSAAGDCKVRIRVYTKNSDEKGDGIAVQESGVATPLEFEVDSDDITVQELVIESVATTTPTNPKGLKELIRLELVGIAASANKDNWNEIRLFPPIFYNAAKP